MTKNKFFYALDPLINRRVVHVKVKDTYISMVTGHKFTEKDVIMIT